MAYQRPPPRYAQHGSHSARYMPYFRVTSAQEPAQRRRNSPAHGGHSGHDGRGGYDGHGGHGGYEGYDGHGGHDGHGGYDGHGGHGRYDGYNGYDDGRGLAQDDYARYEDGYSNHASLPKKKYYDRDAEEASRPSHSIPPATGRGEAPPGYGHSAGRGRGRGSGRGQSPKRGRGRGYAASTGGGWLPGGNSSHSSSRSTSAHALDYRLGPNNSSSNSTGGGAQYGREPGNYRKNIPMVQQKYVQRTLFMRVSSEARVTAGDLHVWFSKFGDVADVCDLKARSGVCYVMFYDLRSAHDAYCHANELLATTKGVHTVQRSRPRPDSANRSPKPSDYQATILLTLRGTEHGFCEEDRARFERIGEVLSFHPYHGKSHEWVLEYYDCRAASEAAKAFHDVAYHRGTLYTTFLWDEAGPPPPSGRFNDWGGDGARPEEVRSQAPRRDPRVEAPPVNGPAPRAAPQRRYEPAAMSGAAEPVFDAAKAAAMVPPPRVAAGKSSERPGSSNGFGFDLATVSRMSKCPDIMQKAQAAKEILQQHQGLLGLTMPDAAAASTLAASRPAPAAALPTPKLTAAELEAADGSASLLAPDERTVAPSAAATPLMSLSELMPRSVPAVSLSGMVPQLTPAASLSELPPQSAPAFSSMASDVVGIDAVRTPKSPTLPVEPVSAPMLGASPPGYAQTGRPVAASKDTSKGDHSDGISRLLGILAQVQQSAYDSARK